MTVQEESITARGAFLDVTWAELVPGHTGGGGTMLVRSVEDVEDLVRTLSQPHVSAALIHHHARDLEQLEGEPVPDHELAAGIHHGFGYLTHFDDVHDYGISLGVPESPEYFGYYVEFDAGDGLPLDQFRAALIEFLTTAQRPTNVEWHSDEI